MDRTTLLTAVLCFWLNNHIVAQTPESTNRINEVKSEWVYPGKDGKLAYKLTPAGDKIMDFSYAGYMGGGVALPIVPVKKVIKAAGDADDTKAIQSAIDEVAAMPMINGFRGTVLLAPGTFICSSTIVIPVSGVVLRGSGSGKGGTTIRMIGSKHTALVIGPTRDIGAPSVQAPQSDTIQPFTPAQTMVTDNYVPAGSNSLTVANAKGFAVGDKIEIIRPVTSAWVHLMEMDNLIRDGRAQTWIDTNRNLVMEREIKAISNNKFMLDIPLADSYDTKYLNPPGVKVNKVRHLPRVIQIGVENLHIQCPPLEIAYGNAPYSGIRINGDDCWIKDVYFEETMNTATLLGNRITMQQVIIKHTYTNLGASKPTDFSIEGSQNLLDRCESTGGNTYFVWTSSLVPGPNVLLNCTFRGYGSRIQPHMRWSTGMLIDNCTAPDGGIDFMNRGVAGSGHGWTMGWGVAWNNIAKTYIIQNPPRSANWAIGNKGSREQTARLFDESPILAEGYFDSHGIPVAPQSLYLAQLVDRLGMEALKNIGYLSNTLEMFANKDTKPLSPLAINVHPILGADLAMHRPVNTSSVRGSTREFGGEKALDGNDKTYWATNDNIRTGIIEIDMENPVKVSAIELSEATILNNRVLAYKVEGQIDSDWKLLSQGKSIGDRKLDKFPETTVWKVRVTILDAKDYPAISKIGLYLE